MKIKQDFVTNSSSTSFIVCSKNISKDIIDFINKVNLVQNEFIKDEGWRENFETPPKITSEMLKQEGQEVTIEILSPIFSDEEKMPQYIKELFINKDSKYYKKLCSLGIEPGEIKIKNYNE